VAALLFSTACGKGDEAKAAPPQAKHARQSANREDSKVDDTTDYVAT